MRKTHTELLTVPDFAVENFHAATSDFLCFGKFLAANDANYANRHFTDFLYAPVRVIRVISGSDFGCGSAAL